MSQNVVGCALVILPMLGLACLSWWRERRGVGRAEVPGELTSEGNRPKGDAPA